jgi:hypothetical protein
MKVIGEIKGFMENLQQTTSLIFGVSGEGDRK